MDLPVTLNKDKSSTKSLNFDIPALTGVRALAAYMVFVHHYYGSNCDALSFGCKILMELHTGVSIFFVLSGFLIAYKYYESSSLNLGWLKGYYVGRFARIYPLLLLVTFFTLLISKSSLLEWFLSLSLLKGFLADYRFAVISQTWTLTVEAVFYFLAPFIFILAKNKASLFLQFVLIFLIGILITSKTVIGDLQVFISGHLFLFIYTFFGRVFEFFVGIFLALLVLKRGFVLHKRFVTYVGLFGVISTIILISTFQSPGFRYGVFSPGGLLIHNFILPIFIAVFFAGLIFEKTILSFILSTKLLILLGQSSYAFYLIHLGVLANLIPGFFRFNMFTFFVTLNLIAIIMFLFIEKPLNKRIRKIV